MERIRKQSRAIPFNIDISDASRPSEQDAVFRRNPEGEASMQYLVWALDEIETSGSSQKAARYTRAAMAALREGIASSADEEDEQATRLVSTP